MFRITAYEHVGIRVTDPARAIAFDEKLGRRVELDIPEAHAKEMVNAAGAYINLILNGAAGATGNVLQDDPVKRPGVAHAAFVVDDLDGLLAVCAREKIPSPRGRARSAHARSEERRVGKECLE